MQHLLPNSTLQSGKYKIIKVLGQGGFGITYLAIQSGLERKVAIKEFFMKELCERDESTSHVTLGTEGSRETVSRFREKFLKEARNIAKLNHSNIVRIIDVFEENGTAYYVMEYAENGSLADKVKREGYLSEPVATRYILQVAEALDYIHQQKMNHLDVKPANIMLNEKDESVLIDFGLSKQYDATTGNQTSTTPVGISEGYAPMEQYMQGGVGEFSPETDIYALGATYFKLLTGATPPNASWVNNEGVPVDELKAKGVSANAISVICNAMEGRKKDRMKNIRTLIDGLKGQVNTSTQSAVPDDDEVTILTPDLQKKEEERLRKEAETKAAKEKAEAEARAMAEAERKAREEAERKAQEEEEAKKKASQKSSSKMWLWIVIGVIVVSIATLVGLNTINRSNKLLEGNLAPQQITSKTFTVNGVSFDMILVKGGTFTMGGTQEMEDPYPYSYEDEKPVHKVTITKNYYIGKTEVTQALWEAVMGDNPSHFKGYNLPVEKVSWNDCVSFITKLNNITHNNFRMPTEAEWEFAARGGNQTKCYRYSGSNSTNDIAWTYQNSSNITHSVATKRPNELGIYDMSGNVWEWCSDWYGEYDEVSQTNPTGPDSGIVKIGRGGGIDTDSFLCKTSLRGNIKSGYSFDLFGLRLVLRE